MAVFLSVPKRGRQRIRLYSRVLDPRSGANRPALPVIANGTLDLRTGILQAHRLDDLITELFPTEYSQEATCPKRHHFLGRVLRESQALVMFIQRAVGYSLTGATTEQVMFVLYGTGANGKSTPLNILRAVFAAYAQQAAFQTFLVNELGSQGPRNDLAALAGARLVASSEVEEGRRLSEVVIKQVTGGDPITCRFLRAEFFEFVPQFKLWLACNHKPVIRGTDHAIWRRVHLIPFEVTIPADERDTHLAEKLQGELPESSHGRPGLFGLATARLGCA